MSFESVVIILVVVGVVIADRTGGLSWVLKLLGKKDPVEPDAQPNGDTPLLDLLEKILSSGFVDVPGAKIIIDVLRKLIKAKPDEAQQLIQSYLPAVHEEIEKAKRN